jgi:hypothetical protein
MSGLSELNSGYTTPSGMRHPTAHVSPTSANWFFWPVPSSSLPQRYRFFPKSCKRAVTCIQSGLNKNKQLKITQNVRKSEQTFLPSASLQRFEKDVGCWGARDPDRLSQSSYSRPPWHPRSSKRFLRTKKKMTVSAHHHGMFELCVLFGHSLDKIQGLMQAHVSVMPNDIFFCFVCKKMMGEDRH